MKTESLAEFIARGGTVTKCPTKVKARRIKRADKGFEVEEVDLSVLPEHLKIRLGIRDGQPQAK